MTPGATHRPTEVLRPRTGPTVVLARGDVEVATWALPRRGRADMAVVDQLARLQLEARRLGCSIRLLHAGAELRELLALSGLDDVIVADE
ncbi:MAG: STAS domain-containing protein [Acidimicrobiia bacterium]|nr:STAS domain-containing protein [Acidimicrobiia bacterium]